MAKKEKEKIYLISHKQLDMIEGLISMDHGDRYDELFEAIRKDELIKQ